MSQDIHTKSTSMEIVLSQVRSKTPASIVSIILRQLDVAADAAGRVTEEGIVVRDMKGSVIPHPAIKIENEANKIITELLTRWQ